MYTPLIPALRMQKQRVPGQPGEKEEGRKEGRKMKGPLKAGHGVHMVPVDVYTIAWPVDDSKVKMFMVKNLRSIPRIHVV